MFKFVGNPTFLNKKQTNGLWDKSLNYQPRINCAK